MKLAWLKKRQILFFAVLLSMVFLLSAARQDIKSKTESSEPKDEKLKITWKFDSGG
ncbi:hypothetical protein ACFLRB_00420 [Acidobacteriota bacterium]